MPHIKEGSKLLERVEHDGQVAATEGDLYTVPALRQAHVISFSLSNTATSITNTVSVYLKQASGSSRRIFRAALAPGDTAYLDPMSLSEGTKLRAVSTYAEQVDYILTIDEEWTP